MMNQEEARIKGVVIQGKMLELSEFHEANTVAFYVAKKLENEVPTELAIRESLARSKRVLVPVTDTLKKKLLFSELHDFDKELAVGTFDILEPREEYRRFADVKNIDLIFVPGVAFDRKGNRVGYGSGYYDIFLSSIDKGVVKIGLAYAFQIVERIPATKDDMKVDRIITENEDITCSEAPDL